MMKPSRLFIFAIVIFAIATVLITAGVGYYYYSQATATTRVGVTIIGSNGYLDPLPTIWLTPTLGYQIQPDDISNAISVVFVGFAVYYAIKIVRLSGSFEYVALKGGRAPYYIVLGMSCFWLERFSDLMTNWLVAIGFPYEWVIVMNDPPATLAAFFIALGLREMYVIYIKNSKVKKPIPAHTEIWETEKIELEA